MVLLLFAFVHKGKIEMKNSYMIIDKLTNAVVLEIWDESLLSKLNTDKYTYKTAYDYLCELNKITQINKL